MRQWLMISALSLSGLSAGFFGIQTLVRSGRIGSGVVGRGLAYSGKATAADGSTEGSPSLLFSREQAWRDEFWNGQMGYD
jgi:hypothetical protein